MVISSQWCLLPVDPGPLHGIGARSRVVGGLIVPPVAFLHNEKARRVHDLPDAIRPIGRADIAPEVQIDVGAVSRRMIVLKVRFSGCGDGFSPHPW